MANAIPVIDLGPYLGGEPEALDRAAAELRHALTEIGFYTIVNHGVPSALVHEVYRQVAQFHARPLDEKLRIKLDKHNVGYLPMMGDTLRTSVVANVTKPNMSEAFFMAATAATTPCPRSLPSRVRLGGEARAGRRPARQYRSAMVVLFRAFHVGHDRAVDDDGDPVDTCIAA